MAFPIVFFSHSAFGCVGLFQLVEPTDLILTFVFHSVGSSTGLTRNSNEKKTRTKGNWPASVEVEFDERKSIGWSECLISGHRRHSDDLSMAFAVRETKQRSENARRRRRFHRRFTVERRTTRVRGL